MRVAILPIGAAAVALLACAAKNVGPVGVPVQHLGPARPVDGPQGLLSAVAAANDGYRTLKQVHRVAIEFVLPNGRQEQRACRGVLAISRPSRFRLTAITGRGVKLFDILHVAGKSHALHLPPQDRHGRLPQVVASIAEDIRAIYRLHPVPATDTHRIEERVAASAAPLTDLRGYRGGQLVSEMTVFARSLAVARTELLGPGSQVRTITYGDYEHHGRLVVPRTIVVSNDGPLAYWLRIRVERTEIDPVLDPRLFEQRQ